MMRELPDEFYPATRDFIAHFPETVKEVDTLLTKNKIFIGRTRDVGIIDPEEAINFGLTGPILRASGVGWDVRKNEPYSSYSDFTFDIPVGEKGDVYDRYWVRMEEMRQSVKIVEQALENMPPGKVNIDNPKIILPEKKEVYTKMEELIHHFMITMEHKGIRPPVGEVYSSTEVPNGELGFYIVSDGTNRPYRVRVRPPSLVNYQIFPKLLEGRMLSDTVAILGSLNIIAGELDR
jgi:NADH:ubiquinone oxidoreductase subunit D